MKHQRYFPPRRSEQNLWLAQFRHKFPGIAARLQMSLEEIADTLADLDWLLWVRRDLRSTLEHATLAAAAYERLLNGRISAGVHPPPVVIVPAPPAAAPVAPGALKRVFKIVQRIKNNQSYETSMGKELGIEADHYRAESPVPTFKLRVQPGQDGPVVVGKVSLYGHAGFWVESRREGEDWAPIGRGFTRSLFRDTRPLLDPTRPEIREYRLRYWDGKPEGEWTAVTSVTVSP